MVEKSDKFEKGDKVVCVDGEYCSRIEEGEVYTFLGYVETKTVCLKEAYGGFCETRFEPVKGDDMNLDKDKIKDVLANAIQGSRLSPKNKPDKGQKISVNGNTVYVVKLFDPNFVDLFFNCFGTWYKKCVKLNEITSSIADQIDGACTVHSESVGDINFFGDKVIIVFTDGSSIDLQRQE